MKLQSVTIQNFRCFQEIAIELHPRLTVFVGANGSGKTGLLTSICACLSPILNRFPFEKRQRVLNIAPYDIRMTGVDQTAPFALLAASAKFEGETEVQWDRIRLRDNTQSTKLVAPSVRSDIKQLYSAVDHIIDSHNDGKPYRLPVFAFYSTNRAVDVPHNRMRPRAMPKSFKRLMGLENALEAKTDFRRSIGHFDLLEQRELREQRDRGNSEASTALNAVRRAIELMIPGVTNPRIDSQSGRFAVDLKDPSGVPIRLHLDQLSDGYQAMLGVVMDFAIRLALANPATSSVNDVLSTEAMMIVDELDLHLHPLWQQRVIPDLLRTFPNTQFVFTTHSPQVATTVPSESMRILSGGALHSAPAGTEGAEAERLLEDVFGAPARSPHVGMTKHLEEYKSLVDAGLADSPQANELRSELDKWSQGNEPLLKRLDLRMANQKWVKR